MEVGRHALLQTLCLTYVYNGMVGIVKLIAAGLVGHVKHDVLESFNALLVLFSCHVAR